MALNKAWGILRDPERRAAYDLEQRWPSASAFAQNGRTPPPPPPVGRAYGTVLDFGRYAGWSFGQLAVHDPDYLFGSSGRRSVVRWAPRSGRPSPRCANPRSASARCMPRSGGHRRVLGADRSVAYDGHTAGSGVVGNARALGARDRGFESRLPDHHGRSGQPLSSRTRTSTTRCAAAGRRARVLGSRGGVGRAATGTPGGRLPRPRLQALPPAPP